RYTYSRINKDNTPLSSSGFVNPTLSLGSTGGKSTSSSSNSANDGYGGSITTGKIDIPFSAPKANGTNNTYLVDPGAMPLNESMRIPVGDGLWILFILGDIYFLRLFFRK
ncbi:MAG: hypothetical protein GX102_06880, partial [Porphyromonadaceae bacterium]|nr:hypothetical protein [Porphyromonadaceae bacterium]